MINFCTVAYGEKYRNLSLLLIESFNKIKNEENKLYILTDNAKFYDNYVDDQLIIYEDITYPKDIGSFKYNYKMFVLNKISKNIGDYVIFLDCDCVIRKPYVTTNLSWAHDGLNACLGKSGSEFQTIVPSGIINASVRKKVIHLNPDVNFQYYQFREAFLLFKIDDSFDRFVEEAKDIFYDLEENRLTHTNVCYDIQVACHRSGMSINNIDARFVPIRDSIFTLGVNGGYCPMIT